MKTISIEIPDGKKAEWKNGVLTLVDENRPVTERIKTYEDAWASLGYEKDPLYGKSPVEGGEDIFAYLKLRIIAKALNEGWEPEFTTSEYRWFPWFVLYTQKEIDEMNAEDKSRVVLRSGDDAVASGGVACASADVDSSSANPHFGSRLAFKTKALAEYAGKQFTDIWADFVFRPKQNPQAEK